MSLFALKKRIDIGLYRIFNLISDCIFMFRFRVKKILRYNRKFKNIHKGQRCFILGTGPSLNSLTKEQVDKLRHEVVFATNSIYKVPVVESITPLYYALMDNFYWDEDKHAYTDIVKKYESHPPIFLTSYKAKSYIEQLKIKERTIFLYAKKYPVTHTNCGIHTNMYIAQNVVGTVIQAAIYMGFKEIYLLGCDYSSFIVQENNHCYDDVEEVQQVKESAKLKYNISWNLAMYLEAYARTTQFHYLIAKDAKKHNIQVINITPKSLLDAYPRKDITIVL